MVGWGEESFFKNQGISVADAMRIRIGSVKQ